MTNPYKSATTHGCLFPTRSHRYSEDITQSQKNVCDLGSLRSREQSHKKTYIHNTYMIYSVYIYTRICIDLFIFFIFGPVSPVDAPPWYSPSTMLRSSTNSSTTSTSATSTPTAGSASTFTSTSNRTGTRTSTSTSTTTTTTTMTTTTTTTTAATATATYTATATSAATATCYLLLATYYFLLTT